MSELQHCNGIWKILVQPTVGYWQCWGTQTCYWASGNLLVKNVKAQQLRYGKRGCSMIMFQSWLLGSQITDKKLFKWPNSKKSRWPLYEIFCYVQHYFAAGNLTPISESISLCSAVPSFSNNFLILRSGFHKEPQEYILKKKLFDPLFMDGVQLSQGYRATKRRQVTFYK